jgi:hypothetical protein
VAGRGLERLERIERWQLARHRRALLHEKN